MTTINVQKLGESKKNLPDIRPGDTVRVSEKILGKSKKKSQVFEGILISKKHGKGINATFTLRAIVGGVGVEKTYPLHLPLIEEIQVVKKGKARRAKLYYLRKKAEREIRKKLKSQRVLEEKKKTGEKELKKEEKETKKTEERIGDKKEEKKNN